MVKLILFSSIFCQLTSDSFFIQIHVALCLSNESSYCNHINGSKVVLLNIIQFTVELRVKNTLMSSFQYGFF